MKNLILTAILISFISSGLYAQSMTGPADGALLIGDISVEITEAPLSTFKGEVVVSWEFDSELPFPEAKLKSEITLYRMLRAAGKGGEGEVKTIIINPLGLLPPQSEGSRNSSGVSYASDSAYRAIALYEFESLGESGRIQSIIFPFGELVEGDSPVSRNSVRVFRDLIIREASRGTIVDGQHNRSMNPEFVDYLKRMSILRDLTDRLEGELNKSFARSEDILGKRAFESETRVVAKIMAIELSEYLAGLPLKMLERVIQEPELLEPIAVVGFSSWTKLNGEIIVGEETLGWDSSQLPLIREAFRNAITEGTFELGVKLHEIAPLWLGTESPQILTIMGVDVEGLRCAERLSELRFLEESERGKGVDNFRLGTDVEKVRTEVVAEAIKVVKAAKGAKL